ncbi:MAG TPA: alpha-galactosidase [Acidimicrobiales bacterium]|nr:alpha-galactosidase [Acidimicrobiales bacterium]
MDGLRYNQGLYRLFENLRRIQPEIYIEACRGGGQSLDLGMVARANGAWLSDHTTVPSVTRYCQTGALRWLPPDYVNMAVTSRDGSPRQHLHPGRLLSRMVGTLSFNGDIAAWSPAEATAVRSWVDVFKQIRDQRGPRARLPLGQPRWVEDWDAAAFLGGESEDLLYIFRDLGPARREIASLGQDDFSVGGDWEIVLADEGVTIDQRAGKCTLELPQWGGALLRRS